MQVDITFDFAKVYNIEKADVAMGQRFTLTTDAAETFRWFSDADPVLSMKVSGNGAEVEAKETGTSTILIMNEANGIEKTLVFKVVDSIEPMATDLGLKAGEPEPK
jgi:hypothetical protein